MVVVEHARRARVDDEYPRAPEVAAAGPPGGRRLAVGTFGELLESATEIAGRRDRGQVEPLLLELRGREVAQVLVQPVGHEGTGDPVVPPRRRPYVLEPPPGDVPVVDHVVVVEHHHAGDGREQPADVGVAPRLAVQPRVLLEVGDLLARWPAGVPSRAHELERLRRHLVGIDLVADQKQRVRPGLDAGPQPPRVGPQCVHPVPVRFAAWRQRVGLALRSADATGAEHQPRPVLALAGVDRAGGVLGLGERPHPLSVEVHLVLEHRRLLEVGQRHQRIMVAAHLEGAGSVAQHVDTAGAVSLDPDGGLGASDVAQQWAEDKGRHAGRLYVESGLTPAVRRRVAARPRSARPTT